MTAKAICIKPYIEKYYDGTKCEYIKGKIYTVVVQYYDKLYFKIIEK